MNWPNGAAVSLPSRGGRDVARRGELAPVRLHAQPSSGHRREFAQAFGLKVLPSEAGMLSRIQRGLREISASTTIVARYGVIANH